MKFDWPWRWPELSRTAGSSSVTRAELADRAGLTQAKISRIEGSDTVPTLPRAKFADALDATLAIALDAEEIRVNFNSRRRDAA